MKPVTPTKAPSRESLLMFVTHAIETARKEQIAFGEVATKDVENALTWHAERAFVAVFTERHGRTVLDQLTAGRDLRPIYENLIDRLVLLACGHDVRAEMRAIADLAKSLKGWLS